MMTDDRQRRAAVGVAPRSVRSARAPTAVVLVLALVVTACVSAGPLESGAGGSGTTTPEVPWRPDARREAADQLEAPETRDPLQWPYPATSIWNHPLGDAARLVPFRMQVPTERTLNAEEDIIILTPEADPVDVMAHDAAWRDGVTRCESRTGEILATGLPIPADFLTDPGYHGHKPNHAAAILLPDMTLFETQPLHVCPDGVVVSEYTNDRWQGDSILTGGRGGDPYGGAHGGSSMTAFGGTIRLGEWVPGGQLRHALKMVVDSSADLSPQQSGYRWPALRADAGYERGYGGAVPEARMGALVALPPSFDVDRLPSEPARILATALRRYGAYVVDGSGWSTAAFATEWGPAGRVMEEFEDVWGFPLVGHRPAADGAQQAFLQDIEQIYTELHVVDDNGPASIGGAGARLAPWAPPFPDGTGGVLAEAQGPGDTSGAPS